MANQAGSKSKWALVQGLLSAGCWIISAGLAVAQPVIKGKQAYRGIVNASVGAGITYYMGDLREEPYQNLQLGPNLSVGATYRLLERLSLRGELRLYNVGGSQVGAKRTQNNLRFRTTNPDAYLGVMIDLFKHTDFRPLNAYVWGGVGGTYLSPRTTLNGRGYSLAKYQTEGQRYARTVLIVPGGIGLRYQYDLKLSIGLELSGTYVNSDYFDDVSSQYIAFADPNSLAARLADRKPELGLSPNQPGFIRGNPRNKDIYIFLGVRAEYNLISAKQNMQRALTKCPR
jgi:hypothetical protein